MANTEAAVVASAEMSRVRSILARTTLSVRVEKSSGDLREINKPTRGATRKSSITPPRNINAMRVLLY
jgi:hypothetical protein